MIPIYWKRFQYLSIYIKQTCTSVPKEIFRFRSSFRHVTETDVFFYKRTCRLTNHKESFYFIKLHCIPFICNPSYDYGECQVIIFKIEIYKNLFKKLYGTRKVRNWAIQSMSGNLNFDDVITTFAEEKARKNEL